VAAGAADRGCDCRLFFIVFGDERLLFSAEGGSVGSYA
jgi:hypothetical protein